jgi:hypothetical protein
MPASARSYGRPLIDTVRAITSMFGRPRYRVAMMLLRTLVIWTVQALLFCTGTGIAGLMAHLFGPLLARAFAIDELIPMALVFFAVAAGSGWLGNRYWPDDGTYCNPLL